MAKWFFTNFGYAVDSARTAAEALILFDPKVHDVVITDNEMPGLSGVELAHVVKMRSPGTLVVMFTGHPPAERSCLDVVVQKPAPLMDLRETLERKLAEREASAANGADGPSE